MLKGKLGKHEDQRKIIGYELHKEHAIRMKGSFGAEKKQHGLHKIKASTKENDILWIFLGVHTPNRVKITKTFIQLSCSLKIILILAYEMMDNYKLSEGIPIPKIEFCHTKSYNRRLFYTEDKKNE